MNTDQAKQHRMKRKSTLLISLISFVGVSSAALLASFFMDWGMSRAAANIEEDEIVDPEEETEADTPVENSHPFDKVFLHTPSGQQNTLTVCFVFTDEEDLSGHTFVAEHASTALELAERFEDHADPDRFMFYSRLIPNSKLASAGGYTKERLQELANAPPVAEGTVLECRTSWVTFCQIPEPDEAEGQP